jgi:hypothetical protein
LILFSGMAGLAWDAPPPPIEGSATASGPITAPLGAQGVRITIDGPGSRGNIDD